jgi:hypothetical protein
VAVGQIQRLYSGVRMFIIPGIISASSKAVKCLKGSNLNLPLKFVTVSLLLRLRNGHFASETATQIQKWLKNIHWRF